VNPERQQPLIGTRFDRAIINRPLPAAGGLADSINYGEINGISVAAADLTAINYLGETDQRNKIFGTRDTLLHFEFDELRQGLRQKQIKLRSAEKQSDESLKNEAERELRETGFMYWCPFDMNDGACGPFHKKFLDAVGLQGFPYE